MSANDSTFEAVIKTTDQASAPLRAITARIAEMTGITAGAERQMGRLDNPGMFRSMAENVGLLRRRFEGLGSSIGAVHGKLSALFPVLGGLAAFGSVGGLVHMVNDVADRRAERLERLQRLGVDPKRLGNLTMLAKAAGVPIEALDTAIGKLSNNMVEAFSGKNKDVAGLFAYLHMNIKDSNHHFRDAGEVMQQFMDVFIKTKDGTLRTAIARALFGKGGAEIMPMMLLAKEEREQLAKDTKGLMYPFTAQDDKNLEAYRRNMGYLKTSVTSLADAVGAQLAPVLNPVILQMKDFLVAHRPEIAKALGEAIKSMADSFRSFDWARLGRDLRYIWDGMAYAVDRVGGLNTVIEILIGWKIAGWALAFVRGLVRVGIEAKAVSAALFGVRDATLAAEGSTAFGGLLGRLALLTTRLTAVGAAVAVLWPTSTADPELDEAPPDGRPRRKDDSAKLSREVYERQNQPRWNWNLAKPVQPLPAGPMGNPRVSFDLPSGDPLRAMLNNPGLSALLNPLPPVPMGNPRLSFDPRPVGPLRPLLNDPGWSGLFNPLPPGPPPQRGGGGVLKVSIDFKNMPQGGAVRVDSKDISIPVETNVGYSNPMGFHF